MQKKISSLFSIVAIVILLSLLFSCARSDSDLNQPEKGDDPSLPPGNSILQNENPPEQTKNSLLEVSTEPVTLHFAINASWLGEGEFQRVFEEPIKKRYPFISFEVHNISMQSLDKMFAAGIVPDIIQSASAISYVYTGLGWEEGIEPLVKKFGFDLSKLNQVAVESVKSASGVDYLSGLPWTMHFSASYYNKDIFDMFGVDYPIDGLTWEEMVGLARSLTRFENGVQYRGMEIESLNSVRGLNTVDPKTNKANFNNEGWRQLFEFMKEIYSIQGNENYGWAPISNNQFITERTLAMLMSANLLPNFKGVEGLNWDIAQYPLSTDLPVSNTGLQVDAWVLHITKQSAYKDQAFLALSTILSEEVQTEISRNGRIPTLTEKSIQDEFGINLPYLDGKNLEAIFKTQPAKALTATKFSGYGNTVLKEAFDQVMKEGLDINSALREADEKLNNYIQSNS